MGQLLEKWGGGYDNTETITLELSEENTKSFKCLGVENRSERKKTDILHYYSPNETINVIQNKYYILTKGKFPFDDYKDLYEHSNQLYEFVKDGKTIYAKIVGFDNSCNEGQVNKYGNCKVYIQESNPIKQQLSHKPNNINV